MTEGKEGSGVARGTAPDTKPRAMIHRKILDIASKNPEASLDDIAGAVSGASVSFVERVFEEYGDPARSDRSSGRTDGNGRASRVEPTDANRDGSDAVNASRNDPLSVESSADDGPTETGDTSTANAFRSASDGEVDDSATITDASQLSERQRETLVAVAERPTATQAEIADELGVSRATVSKRLGDVDGFEWADRQSFVERLFDRRGGTDGTLHGRSPAEETTSDSGEPAIAELESRIDSLESELQATGLPGDGTDDPKLTHKVLHACMDAEYISEEEELAVIRRMLDGDV